MFDETIENNYIEDRPLLRDGAAKIAKIPYNPACKEWDRKYRLTWKSEAVKYYPRYHHACKTQATFKRWVMDEGKGIFKYDDDLCRFTFSLTRIVLIALAEGNNEFGSIRDLDPKHDLVKLVIISLIRGSYSKLSDAALERAGNKLKSQRLILLAGTCSADLPDKCYDGSTKDLRRYLAKEGYPSHEKIVNDAMERFYSYVDLLPQPVYDAIMREIRYA